MKSSRDVQLDILCFYRENAVASNWMQEGDGAYGTGACLCVLFSRRKQGKSAEILQKNL